MNRTLDILLPAAYNVHGTMKTALPAVHNTAAVGLQKSFWLKINRPVFLRPGRLISVIATVENSLKNDEHQKCHQEIIFHHAAPPFIIYFGIARFSDEKETNRLPLCNCERGTVPPSFTIISSVTFFVNREIAAPLDIARSMGYNKSVTMKTALPAVHNTAAVGLQKMF